MRLSKTSVLLYQLFLALFKISVLLYQVEGAEGSIVEAFTTAVEDFKVEDFKAFGATLTSVTFSMNKVR